MSKKNNKDFDFIAVSSELKDAENGSLDVSKAQILLDINTEEAYELLIDNLSMFEDFDEDFTDKFLKKMGTNIWGDEIKCEQILEAIDKFPVGKQKDIFVKMVDNGSTFVVVNHIYNILQTEFESKGGNPNDIESLHKYFSDNLNNKIDEMELGDMKDNTTQQSYKDKLIEKHNSLSSG